MPPAHQAGRFEEDPVNGIHVYARIVSIADAYSALLMKRVYKPALPAEKALELLTKSAPDDFDLQIFEPFAQCVTKSLGKLKERKEAMGRNGQIIQLEKCESLVKKINETRKIESQAAADLKKAQ